MRMRQIAPLLVLTLIFSGCASNKHILSSLAGVNWRDLKESRDPAVAIRTSLSYEKAFQKALDTADATGLTVYQKDFDKGFIVVMGLAGQVDTTRVGLFFETEEQKTVIGLGSLSRSAMKKAREIFARSFKDDS